MKPIDELSDDELAQIARRAADMPDAPEPLVRAAIALFDAHAASSLAHAVRRAVGRIVASLAFDSFTPATAVGVRATPSETRQLLFSAMDRDIDLRIMPSADAFSLRGQVLGPDRAGTVELRAAGDAESGGGACVAVLDELGEFQFESISPGRYAMTVRVDDLDIALPPIDVGATPP